MARKVSARAPWLVTGWLITAWSFLALIGCSANSIDPLQMSIERTVVPVDARPIARLCIQVNGAVKTEHTEALYASLGELGFATLSRSAAFGDECRYWLEYTVQTSGLTGYLRDFQVMVYDRKTEIGRARYDATSGASRPDRLGSVSGKMHTLLEQLLAEVRRAAE